jgi:hypothetical protein
LNENNKKIALVMSGGNWIIKQYISNLNNGFEYEYEESLFVAMPPLPIKVKFIRKENFAPFKGNANIGAKFETISNSWVVYPDNGGIFNVPAAEDGFDNFDILSLQLLNVFNQSKTADPATGVLKSISMKQLEPIIINASEINVIKTLCNIGAGSGAGTVSSNNAAPFTRTFVDMETLLGKRK